ncbi:non-ribosomal peptide synthetase [Nocardiopsis baichengensis]|uniref:non-ribosomal peptide synthetase n=1 Tax=Nocardiopsis baichengensis TaxID=280240 RepID=UPI00034D6E5F|nr:non-ribosomal peptide synthetase [Nocardiopsis baichengensis]
MFRRRARAHPDAVALVHGRRQVSYRELDAASDDLAVRLAAAGAGRGAVAMVRLERGVDSVTAFLGALKAGAVYLPVEYGTPDARLELLARESGCAAVVAAEGAPALPAGLGHLPRVTVGAAAEPPPAGAQNPGPAPCPGDLAYLVFTSGSTGAPKGVQVEHGSLAHLSGAAAAEYGITPQDRVLQFGALSFDTSIEQMAVALVSGAALVLPETAWAPSEMPGRLAAHGVTVMDLTPLYWHRVLDALESGAPVPPGLRLAIVGGEAVPADDCLRSLRLLPGVRLVNAYGLTETTITTCVKTITPDDLRPGAPAPVGRPLPGTEVRVLDADLRPVADGRTGEVWIGGAGVARGYAGRPDLTRERFRDEPGAAPGARLYRTGDLGRINAAGDLEIAGRADRQVKIRGFRVEPDEVEAALGGCAAVGAGAVNAVERGGRTVLAAYYTPAAGAPGAAEAEAALREELGRALPAHMVPEVFVRLGALPLHPSGKVDRARLPVPEAPSDTAPSEPASADASASGFERGMARLWEQVLGVREVGPDADFFALGGDSILASELTAKVRAAFSVPITQVRPLIRVLLQEPVLRSFAGAVREARAGRLDGGRGLTAEEFEAEAEPGVEVRRDPEGPAPRRSDPGEILLTGATGFLGAHLLRELLATTGARVHCLVRAGSGEHALERIRANARAYFPDDLTAPGVAERIVPLPGDLAEPRLGLSEEDFDRLARTVDAVHHPGGEVNFVYPYSRLRGANVEGTREILRLATRYRNIPVHYVSTMAVVSGYGTAGVRHVTEDTPLAHPDHLSVGYVETKWVAERMLQKAARQGLAVSVFRAADISGDTVSGAWNTATEMCAVKRFIVDTGKCPVAELPLDYTPADRYAAALAHIARTAPLQGEVYHLTNPGKANISLLADRLRAHGHPVEEVPWEEWIEELVTLAVERPGHPMAPFVPLFVDRCATGEMSVAEMYLETAFPVFTRNNVDKALQGSGICVPPVDADMLDSYIRHLTSIGYLGGA